MKYFFLLIKNLKYSMKGYFIWRKIKRQIDYKNDIIWLFTNEEEYAVWGINLLKEFIEHNGNKKVHFIITDEIKKNVYKYENYNLSGDTFLITDKQYLYLECLYNLCGENLRWFLISCEKPCGRNIKNYLFDENIGLKELFKVGVLGIIN